MILEAVSRSRQAVSGTELTSLLGIDRSSVFRLANTLKRRGFLACPNGRKDYILGPSLCHLLHHYDWSGMLMRIVRPHLMQLAALTGETAHLAVQEGEKARFIDQVVGNHLISVSGQVGELVPLYCTAHGKALLADCGAAELRAIFGKGPLKAYTARSLVSVPALAAECVEIRSRGVARDDGEFQDGLRCVAAPIRDGEGAVIGSIGVSAPQIRFPDQRYEICGKQVLRTVREIRDALTARPREGATGTS